MTSVCITRSISIDSQDGFYSPSLDLGKDFELLIRKCIAEKMAREQEMTDNFGNDQIEAASNDAASLDLPLDSENESPPKFITKKEEEICEVNNNMAEKACEDCVTQHYENQTKDIQKDREEKLDCQTVAASGPPAAEMKPNSPGRPDHDESTAADLDDSPFAEFEFPSLTKEQTPLKKKKAASTGVTTGSPKKTLPKKRKWKPLGQENISFDMSLLPRRATVVVTDTNVIYDMREELKKFEKELVEAQTAVQDGARVEETKTETESKLRESVLNDRILYEDIIKDNADYRRSIEAADEAVEVDFYENKVPKSEMGRLEKLRDNKACKRLRKKKWKHQKARKAIKTKHLNKMNVWNKPHGQKLFIHHRLLGYGVLYRLSNYLPSPRGKKLSDIDGKGFIFSEIRGGHKVREYNGAHNNAYNNAAGRYTPAPARNYPVAQPVPAYALRNNNADVALDNNLVNVLINLQNRELTPEDYELLLRLDERVAPKTVNDNILDSFKTDVVTDKELTEACTVCMENYQIGQQRKHLPCSHIFHKNCIETWLKNSSLNCPLDGLSVE